MRTQVVPTGAWDLSQPTWRHCPDCDVSWESPETACWCCNQEIEPDWRARPVLTSQVSPVAALTDQQCLQRGLPA